jgi:queuine tRNA-ribosyltransferase
VDGGSGFQIDARDGSPRAGVLRLPHGTVKTPAFVPLASSGAVRGLHAAEVREVGYEMVLGNTFHLFIRPGAARLAEMGGLHEFMAWNRPIITDSGGFQVFSMGHGTVAEEIKRSGGSRGERMGKVLAIEEEGVSFRSYLDGSEQFMGPETSMEVQAAIGSDIALAFDECTPFHASREYTQRSTERTHRWLDRCVAWHAGNADPARLLYGIVQGGTHEDLRAESVAYVAGAGVGGIAIGGSLGKDKAEMATVVGWSVAGAPDHLPRHLLGVGDVDDLIEGVRVGVDTFDCATPTRLGRHGTALVADPEGRWRLDLTSSRHATSREPIAADCPCPACREHSRGYLHYLARAKELTGVRLLTLHNLTFVHALMERLREAITAGSYEETARNLLEGGSPYRA